MATTEDKNGGNGNGNGGPKKSAEEIAKELKERTRKMTSEAEADMEARTKPIVKRQDAKTEPATSGSNPEPQATEAPQSQDEGAVPAISGNKPRSQEESRDFSSKDEKLTRVSWTKRQWLVLVCVAVVVFSALFLALCSTDESSHKVSATLTVASSQVRTPPPPPPAAKPELPKDDAPVQTEPAPPPQATPAPVEPATPAPAEVVVAKHRVAKAPRAMPATPTHGNKAFMKGLKNPSELATLIEVSLEVDSSGHTMLNADRCKKDGSCARPVDYLNTLQVYDPDAGLSKVNELPGYFRSLVIDKAPHGKYYMACVKLSASGAVAVHDCMARSFEDGEHAWVNPKTHRVVLAQNCTNPVGKLYPERTVVVVRPPPQVEPCFVFELDGRKFPVHNPLQTVVSFYRHDDGEDLHKLEADACFYAEDGATGARMRLDAECALCRPGEQQAVWPTDVPVRTKTKYVFSVYTADGKTFGFPSGYGKVYVPRWFVASSMWCFTADQPYWAKPPKWYYGARTIEYDAYFDRTTQSEMDTALKAGAQKFPRPIRPNGILPGE